MSINISRHFMWFFGFPVQLLFCIWPLSILQTVLGFGITAQSTAWHERQHDTSMHSQCIMKGNERADRLACKAAITSGLHLRRSEMLRSLRHCLWVQTKDITPSVAWRRETKSRSSLKREKGLSLFRPAFELFQKWHQGNTWPSTYGFSQACRYHLEVNWIVVRGLEGWDGVNK